MRAQSPPPGTEILGPYEFDQLIGRQGPSGPRLRCPMDIAVDASGVYWTNRTGGTIAMVAP